jgi:hypothetical protein
MGEEARRSGTDFERSIAAMLTQLGYQIELENQSVPCQVQTHAKRPHGIDFLARPINPDLGRPIASPNGLTVFSCKHDLIGDSDIRDLEESFECLKCHPKYHDVSGAILVTSSWVQRHLQEKFSEKKEVYLWDQAKCHLYGNLARYYSRMELSGRNRSGKKVWSMPDFHTTVTVFLSQTGIGYMTLFNYYELGIFYEGNFRLNLDVLEGILDGIRKSNVLPRFSLNRIIIHTTKGFTADFPTKMDASVMKFVSRTIGLICYTSDLYDHSNPWFPSYI